MVIDPHTGSERSGKPGKLPKGIAHLANWIFDKATARVTHKAGIRRPFVLSEWYHFIGQWSLPILAEQHPMHQK